MTTNTIIALGLAAVAAVAYKKRKSTPKAKSVLPPVPPAGPSGETISLLFGPDCEWSIPEVWWQELAQPRLAAILQNTISAKATWQERLAAVQARDPKAITLQILSGQTPVDRCALPSMDADWMQPPESQAALNMYAFASHILEHVEASIKNFTESKGTKVELPVPLPPF